MWIKVYSIWCPAKFEFESDHQGKPKQNEATKLEAEPETEYV